MDVHEYLRCIVANTIVSLQIRLITCGNAVRNVINVPEPMIEAIKDEYQGKQYQNDEYIDGHVRICGLGEENRKQLKEHEKQGRMNVENCC